MQNCCGDGDAT